MKSFRFIFLLPLLFLLSCTQSPISNKGFLFVRLTDYNSLKSWKNDDHAAALVAFRKSCARILKQDPGKPFGPLEEAGFYEDWMLPCKNAMAMTEASPTEAREFFEYYFVPWEAREGSSRKGLFTGYYEPLLKGSLQRHAQYQFPLHALPDDLVSVDLGQFREDLRGRRIAGRITNRKLRPYEDRATITSGAWPHNDKVLVWVDNPVDAFFLHIQGSGRIQLDSGEIMRVGYAGQNGHPYYAIGRELVARGVMPKEQVSLQTIRAWLETHTSDAYEIMNTNRSYVFFQQLEGEGPLGGEGIALTPQRSLAIDRSLIPYGIPIWLVTEPPIAGQRPFNQLMIAQDTGGAIRGPVRGDVYWGAGERAEYIAGQMKVQGKYWFLLPRTAEVRISQKPPEERKLPEEGGGFFGGLFDF